MIITDSAAQYGLLDFPFLVAGIAVTAIVCLYGLWQKSSLLSTAPVLLLIAGIFVSWLIQPVIKRIFGTMTPSLADLSLALAMGVILGLLFLYSKRKARQ